MTKPTIVAFAAKAGAGKDTAGNYLVSCYGFTKVPFAGPLKDACAATFGLTYVMMNDNGAKEAPLNPGIYPFGNLDGFKRSSREIAKVVFSMTYNEANPLGDSYTTTLKRFPFEAPKSIIEKVVAQMVKVFEPLLFDANGVGLNTGLEPLTPRKILQLVGTEVMRSIWPNVWIDVWMSRALKLDRVAVTDCRFENEAWAVKTYKGLVIGIDRPGSWGAQSNVSHQSELSIEKIEKDAVLMNDKTIDELWQQLDTVLFEKVPDLRDEVPVQVQAAAPAQVDGATGTEG